jgi:hypothetical protein
MPAALIHAPGFVQDVAIKLAGGHNSFASINLEKLCWTLGLNKPWDFIELCRQVGMIDASTIHCPMLCLASEGEGKAFLRQADEVCETLGTSKKSRRIFTVEEGADAHCQLNNPSLMRGVIFDWLDEVFSQS